MADEKLLSYNTKDGKEPAVLFIHGFLGSAHQWSHLTDHLRGDHERVTIELPGHGHNRSSQPYRIEDLAHAIKDVLQELQIKTVHLVGHSMGGYVGCAFAKAYPLQTLSLTLINSCAGADSLERRQQRNRSLELIDKFPKAFTSMAISNLFTTNERARCTEVIHQMKTDAQQIGIKAIKNAIIAMRDRPSYLEDLTTVSFPIHYIYGIQDVIIPPDLIQRELEYLNPKISAKLDAGHMSILTHTQEITNNIDFVLLND